MEENKHLHYEETMVCQTLGFVRTVCMGKCGGGTKPPEPVCGGRALDTTVLTWSSLSHTVRPKQYLHSTNNQY